LPREICVHRSGDTTLTVGCETEVSNAFCKGARFGVLRIDAGFALRADVSDDSWFSNKRSAPLS
jgi:hypothetical protein